MPNATIIALEYTLGADTVTYEELEQRFGEAAMRKVFAGSGIRNRRVAPAGVCGSDLAFDAADRLLETRAVDRAGIDLLIHCTQTPDYLMPTTACLLQDRLALPKTCAAFDINLGCSQYVYALSIAHSMIHAGVAHRALVTTGDTMARTVNARDRALAPLLGDAGSATLLEPAAEGTGFLGFEMGTDGSGAKYLILPAGGFRQPTNDLTGVEAEDAEGNIRSPENFYMHGAAVFHFAITTVPSTVNKLVAKLGLELADIDLFLFHQANRFMLDHLCRKLGIAGDRTHVFLEDIGNTSGTALPIVLAEAMRAGKVKPGGRVLMMSFGVGLSWAAAVWRV